jgi:hypothetical protein
MGRMMHFARGFTGTALALALGACASTQPAAEPPAAGPEPARAAAPAPARTPGGSREVAGADGIARLCDVLRDEDGIPFEGNEVARARAREEHQHARLEAADQTYSVEVPAAGFAFRGYDLSDRRLTVDTARSFVLADGVEVVSNDREANLAFGLSPEAAEAALAGHEQSRLGLRLTFRPAHSDLRRDACVRLSGGRVVKLPVEVLAYSLLSSDGATLARGQVSDFVDETPVATPQVTVSHPRSSEGREIPDAVASAAGKALVPALLPCYRKALEARPNLRGTLVIELRVLADGKVESPRMQMSSLGDEALVACSVAKAAHAQIAGVGATPRMSLPVTFSAKEDR